MLSREIKFIILRNEAGQLKHYKSDYLHHFDIARHYGYNSSDIIEAGLFLSGHKYILECLFIDHLKKRENFYIGNKLQFTGDKTLENWLKSRELEARLYYSIKPLGRLPEGD